MTSRRSLALCLALAALLALACVTPVTEKELEESLEQSTSRIPNLGHKRVIAVYADTRLHAKALLLEAKAFPDSEFSALMGKRIAAASRRHFSVVVGGPYPELTEQVLANALALNREDGLAGMKLVLVGAQGPSSELTRAAREAHARLYHHSPH